MTWQISGRSMELCSCKAFCPCWLGPEGEPDQEWCAGMFGFEVEKGTAGGVDLGGSKVVLLAHWPANFFAGNGSARLYLDEGADDDQRRELEAIFTGRNGGVLEPLWGAVLSNWHPTRFAAIELSWDGDSTAKVDGIGQSTLKPFQDDAGNSATLSGAAAMAAFQLDSMVLANGKGSNWADPDLGSWQGDSGTLHKFDWTA